MNEIFLNVQGNGYATTDALPPLQDGELFTINFYPDADAELLDVRAFDLYDFEVALPAVVNNEITMNWRAAWGNLYVDIYFSGSTPPEPPAGVPWWLIIGLKKNNERGIRHVRN